MVRQFPSRKDTYQQTAYGQKEFCGDVVEQTEEVCAENDERILHGSHGKCAKYADNARYARHNRCCPPAGNVHGVAKKGSHDLVNGNRAGKRG